MSDVVVVPASIDDRETLANLVQLYRHDLSEFDRSEVIGERGQYPLGRYFERYWTEDSRFPFLIRANGSLAGFALVREVEQGTLSMAEFFICRAYRREGIGSLAARQLFDRFPCRWEVAQDEQNIAAQNFWRKVIDSYTNGGYEEDWSDAAPIGPKQRFLSARAGRETPL